jgi:SsrA-binding protein
MAKPAQKTIRIENRRARFEYELLDTFTAGMVLMGSEIKSIREGAAGLVDAYCMVVEGELWVKHLHIAPWRLGTHANHLETRDRKLLLKKNELKKIDRALKDKGITLVPTLLFLNDSGLAKLDIALAKGKKLHDKRASLKEKDADRESQRAQDRN